MCRSMKLSVLAFWSLVLLVGALSLTPVENLPPQVLDIWDKAQHACAFAAMTWLGLMAYGDRTKTLLAGLLLYGALIELAQAATGWRYGDWLDWTADAVGIAAGLAVHAILRARWAQGSPQ